MILNVTNLDHRAINESIRHSAEDVLLTHCCGQRFIGAGLTERNITIHGTPGNALGAYLNGSEITVDGNAQDAVGDTMNDGKIVIHGNIGDAAGYAMRGGEILVKGNAGYRAGIHMKEYREKCPVLVIGGSCGSFLGEYQAGGVIIVLGLGEDAEPIIGDFPCTGMHGGKIFLRSDAEGIVFPANVTAVRASEEDLSEIDGALSAFCNVFGIDKRTVLDAPFTKIAPGSHNPYKQMYVAN